MSKSLPHYLKMLLGMSAALLVSGCADGGAGGGFNPSIFGNAPIFSDAPIFAGDPLPGAPEPTGIIDGSPVPVDAPVVHTAAQTTFGMPTDPPPGFAPSQGPRAAAENDGPYLLDTGDRLRVFIYGQPNLSRSYTVDHDGTITVPLIGAVHARGSTIKSLASTIRAKLGTEYVRDPQVTVDVLQNRPFFILGEVKTAGQYPYVSGMTIETAIAIAGGHSERASMRTYRITRRTNGFVEQIEAPGGYVPGDTVFVHERFF
jgi:polysaccharide biosynthesis/export protein